MLSRTMSISNRAEAVFLFLGDVLILYGSLFLTLFFRYPASSEFDFRQMVGLHMFPFSILFVLWLLVFFIAGLYEKHTLFLQKQLPQLLTKALFVNVVIAIVFFYFLPAFKIAPKVNLFLCLFVSSIFLFLWRRYNFSVGKTADKEQAVIIGSGEEMERISREINNNPRYRIRFVFSVDPDSLSDADTTDFMRRVTAEEVSLIVVDLHAGTAHHLLPRLFELLTKGVRFADMHKVYEDMFDRIPLSLVQHNWFLENLSPVSSRFTYDFLKRLMDIIISSVLGLLSLVLYPFLYVTIKLDDGGPIFVHQKRVGKNNRSIRTIKFRTMSRDDAGREELKQGNKVTRVGAFLRRTRIDELPQLWNVVRGDMSLIGPRPELPSLVEIYEREVPYYGTRHLIKPGLSGWAQLYHKNPPKVDANPNETAIKLSYDLYYLKNRSVWLDLKIALKTVKVLLSRSGV
ncbi:MAG: exopolysaccharide biosynthesis polyprenyl glycosylphosphotransferase [Candidatus Taylorbacteria bacterium]|nr:exopolysaccharide biosynthesis polyprenyl glycosylphosphotransferase [Candidatus Taylorbacteria bacterium]